MQLVKYPRVLFVKPSNKVHVFIPECLSHKKLQEMDQKKHNWPEKARCRFALVSSFATLSFKVKKRNKNDGRLWKVFIENIVAQENEFFFGFDSLTPRYTISPRK